MTCTTCSRRLGDESWSSPDGTCGRCTLTQYHTDGFDARSAYAAIRR
jgi:hypothetical protein